MATMTVDKSGNKTSVESPSTKKEFLLSPSSPLPLLSIPPPPKSTTTKTMCQECRAGVVLYQCPRCSFRSCSLKCCLAHKKRTQCNGKRIIATENNAFLPLSRMSDQTLQQDYHFLEHVLQTVESNQRQRPQSILPQSNHHNNNKHKKRPRNNLQQQRQADGESPNTGLSSSEEPHPLLKQHKESSLSFAPAGVGRSGKFRNLVRSAAFPNRRVTLVLMSPGMQRPLQNKSYMKRQVIYWTVDCKVYSHADDDVNNNSSNHAAPPNPSYTFQVLLSEESILKEELSKHMEQRQRQLAKLGTRDTTVDCILRQKDDFDLLLDPNRRQRYRLIGASSTLQQALQDSTLLEFPTVHWVPQSQTKFFHRLIAVDDVVNANTIAAADAAALDKPLIQRCVVPQIELLPKQSKNQPEPPLQSEELLERAK